MMGGYFKRLWSDPDYFAVKMRLIFGALAAALTQGIIPLSEINERLGAAGWWVGIVLAVTALGFKAGDTTPEAAKNLAQADPVKLNAMLTNVGAEPVSLKGQAKAEEAAVEKAKEG